MVYLRQTEGQIQQAFSQQTFWLVIVRKVQVLQITPKMVLLYSAVPVSCDSVTVSQLSQHQDPETRQLNGIQPSLIFISIKGRMRGILFCSDRDIS